MGGFSHFSDPNYDPNAGMLGTYLSQTPGAWDMQARYGPGGSALTGGGAYAAYDAANSGGLQPGQYKDSLGNIMNSPSFTAPNGQPSSAGMYNVDLTNPSAGSMWTPYSAGAPGYANTPGFDQMYQQLGLSSVMQPGSGSPATAQGSALSAVAGLTQPSINNPFAMFNPGTAHAMQQMYTGAQGAQAGLNSSQYDQFMNWWQGGGPAGNPASGTPGAATAVNAGLWPNYYQVPGLSNPSMQNIYSAFGINNPWFAQQGGNAYTPGNLTPQNFTNPGLGIANYQANQLQQYGPNWRPPNLGYGSNFYPAVPPQLAGYANPTPDFSAYSQAGIHLPANAYGGAGAYGPQYTGGTGVYQPPPGSQPLQYPGGNPPPGYTGGPQPTKFVPNPTGGGAGGGTGSTGGGGTGGGTGGGVGPGPNVGGGPGTGTPPGTTGNPLVDGALGVSGQPTNTIGAGAPSSADQALAAEGGNQGYLKSIIDQSGMPVDQTPAWQAMIAAEQRNIEQNKAQLEETFGVSGNRFSTAFGTAMGDYMNQANLQQNAMLTQAQAQAAENAANRVQGAATSLGGFGQQALSQLSSQDFQSKMQQMAQAYSAAQNLFGAGAGAAGQLASAGNQGALALLGGSITGANNLFNSSNTALNNMYGGQLGAITNMSNASNAAGMTAAQLNPQVAQILAQLGLGNLSLGGQLGGQQYGQQQQANQLAYNEWLRQQPQYNPLIPYMYSGATSYPEMVSPFYAPSTIGPLLSGAGAGLGGIAAIYAAINNAQNQGTGGGGGNGLPNIVLGGGGGGG